MNKLSLALLMGLTFAGCTADKDGDDTNTDDTNVATDDTEDTEDTEDTAIEDPFVFATDAPSAYTRVDRSGMPAINTAVIQSKDAYNAADPADDVNLTFAGEIIGSLSFLHSALDDDLAAAGLVPCTVVGDGSGSCIAQAGPLVIPDTLKIDLLQVDTNTNFPNGRQLADPVIDVTLAVILLDLSTDGQDVTTLVGLNPPANDVAFSADFPFLADAH